MPKVSQTVQAHRVQSMLAGIAKRVPPSVKLKVRGKVLSRAELSAFYQSYLDALAASQRARVALRIAVAKERAIARQIPDATRTLCAYVTATFGRTPDAFGDFGWPVPKAPGPKTVAAKVMGAERLRATRKARRTMGKRQRAKVKGGEG